MALSKKQTQWGLIFIVLISIFTYVVIPYGQKMLQLGTGYAAKFVCSHMFVSDFTLDEALEHLTIYPISETQVMPNSESKTVHATLWGMAGRTAYFYKKGELCGCTLDEPMNKTKLPEVTGGIRQDTTWPIGNQLVDSIQQLLPQKEIQSTLHSFMEKNPEIHAIAVAHEDGALIESYRSDIAPTTKLLGWSMTKSFLSVVFGILEKEGRISLDQSLPTLVKHQDKPITFRHALQMNTGLSWDENYFKVSPATNMLFFSKDISQVPSKSIVEGTPGRSWEYSSGTTNILSAVLFEILGEDYHGFLHHQFFDRIGMSSALVETDLTGHYVMSSFGWANLRDWTRFGLLLLNQGNWYGDQLFDQDWYEFITTISPTSEGVYGGHVWLNEGGEYPDVPKDAFFADGFGNQRVLVVPSKNVVISVLAGHAPEANLNELFSEVLSYF